MKRREKDETPEAEITCLNCLDPGRHWVEPTRKVDQGFWTCDIGWTP